MAPRVGAWGVKGGEKKSDSIFYLNKSHRLILDFFGTGASPVVKRITRAVHQRSFSTARSSPRVPS